MLSSSCARFCFISSLASSSRRCCNTLQEAQYTAQQTELQVNRWWGAGCIMQLPCNLHDAGPSGQPAQQCKSAGELLNKVYVMLDSTTAAHTKAAAAACTSASLNIPLLSASDQPPLAVPSTHVHKQCWSTRAATATPLTLLCPCVCLHTPHQMQSSPCCCGPAQAAPHPAAAPQQQCGHAGRQHAGPAGRIHVWWGIVEGGEGPGDRSRGLACLENRMGTEMLQQSHLEAALA